MTISLSSRLWIALVALLISATAASAQETPDAIMLTPDNYAWSPGPASIPPGARVMVVEGNPAAEGEFTMRLWMPAGYVIAPHSHPATEHVTVISGAFYMGRGDTVDEARAMRLPPGSFAMMSVGTTHFAFTREETIVQLHGVGPWGLTYVDPADDPRNAQ